MYKIRNDTQEFGLKAPQADSEENRLVSDQDRLASEEGILDSRLQRFLNLKSATVSGGTFYSPDIKNIV